ncbi:MAG TPA: type I DNA topoisomerase [Acidimicrobiales bacterium]|nr:type I DNA topoisomerase [Acidimicrobiales bacterium]
MPKSLVIVESPNKVKSISSYLGSDYVVLASVGHVRDLEPKGLAVDVDNHFKPTYSIYDSKKKVIAELRAALKDADQLLLATDEDREGEAISWHLVEILKPRVPVKRMVFHEITRPAIERAVEESRDIDYRLVDAQESRRIVDRLFGYPVSEVVWRKIRTGLSAGRVQSPAVRLVVQRERERMAFVASDYWSLEAAFPGDPDFTAGLNAVDGRKVAAGKADFDAGGAPAKAETLVLDEDGARSLAARLDGADFSVRAIETSPYRSRPKPPFITSTLQQVGGSRLRMSAQQVMRVAQGLYERGFITYMRTDSTTLSGTAVAAARSQIATMFGATFVPAEPRTYPSRSKNAQEAHEAIRPAGETFRSPDEVAGELRGADLELYRLIWQRTLASQMPDATGSTVRVRIVATSSAGEATEWSTSGRTITFPGHLAVYGFAGDDAEAADDDEGKRLPAFEEGQRLAQPAIAAEGHTTQPPARYTEAQLVKAREEKGIGRPSTYASIMETIQNRGYVRKKGQALVPTADAFAVVNLLEGHFSQLVDYDFTARMENDLDEIAAGTAEREPWLNKFWFGNGTPGLRGLCDSALADADPAAVNAIPIGLDPDGEPIVVRNGKYGAYVKRGDDTATLPEDLALDELTPEVALELLRAPKGDTPIGQDPDSGLPVYVKVGRFGPYVQLGDPDTLPAKQKPKMASLFKDMEPSSVTVDDALRLLSLPRIVGVDPGSGEEITAQNGRYGPYLAKGKDSRSLEREAQLFSITLDEALAIYSQPKTFGRARAAAKPPLRDLGVDPAVDKPVVIKEGRFGPYITDGEYNVTVPRSESVEEITAERALELLADKRAAGPPAKAKGTAKKAGGRKKAAGTKKAAAKKAAPRKKAAGSGKAAVEQPLPPDEG